MIITTIIVETILTMIIIIIITTATILINRIRSETYFWLQAWLVPHDAEEEAKIGYCGFGSAPAVHSGFSVSWQGALRKAVCSIVTGAVGSEGHNATKMRLLVTGNSW